MTKLRKKISKGHILPYGTLAGASQELRQAYYSCNGTTCGYKNDSDMPEMIYEPDAPENCISLEEEMHIKDRAKLANALLALLSDRQAKILILRYGLDGSPEHSIEEIGSFYCVSGTRIREIEKISLRKMRLQASRL